MNLTGDPTLYLFAGSNGAGKTTFASAYLRQLDPIPRFLNADEIARGLSPLDPQKLTLKAGKLLLHEIQGCVASGNSFGLESTLSGTTYTKLLQQAKPIGFQIEIHYLWIPSPSLAIRRIAQRVKMGGHSIPDADVKRRFSRSLEHFLSLYAPLADRWTFQDNTQQPAALLFESAVSTLTQVREFLNYMKSPKAIVPPQVTKEQSAFIARSQAAAKLMAKELRAEHKRWNLSLLSWKDGKIVATKP